jgi:hypothetical protein
MIWRRRWPVGGSGAGDQADLCVGGRKSCDDVSGSVKGSVVDDEDLEVANARLAAQWLELPRNRGGGVARLHDHLNFGTAYGSSIHDVQSRAS